MLLSAVSVLVVAQSSSEIPEGLMNIPVLRFNVQQLPEGDDLDIETCLSYEKLCKMCDCNDVVFIV